MDEDGTGTVGAGVRDDSAHGSQQPQGGAEDRNYESSDDSTGGGQPAGLSQGGTWHDHFGHSHSGSVNPDHHGPGGHEISHS
jgi:hypothetical protein